MQTSAGSMRHVCGTSARRPTLPEEPATNAAGFRAAGSQGMDHLTPAAGNREQTAFSPIVSGSIIALGEGVGKGIARRSLRGSSNAVYGCQKRNGHLPIGVVGG